MSTPTSELRTIIERLPFSVDDTAAANNAFRRWRNGNDADAERIVDMWTYCYICRYFLSKSSQGAFDHASDTDELTTRAYRKVLDNRDGVRNPDRYANWVSVICKNTFLNYTRRDQFSESVEEEEGPTLTAEKRQSVAEVGFVREALDEAIGQLPQYLQKPARLYFLEDREFEEISDAVDKPVATVRTYKHKAVKRLRTDERLQEYVNRPNI
ncbi:MAG: sigma-70 family RNA polymerase sigma factor [Bacteroidetes bacterium QH_2_64_26]|nr:MAG: sigma-70 family RNA polymerase sigma factor [Bacteroidetes bacterium QH_2_64_26]